MLIAYLKHLKGLQGPALCKAQGCASAHPNSFQVSEIPRFPAAMQKSAQSTAIFKRMHFEFHK